MQTWSAEHDGYQRLSPSVTHRRSVTLDSPSRRLTVRRHARRPAHRSTPCCAGSSARTCRSSSTARTRPCPGPVGGERRQGTLALPTELAWTSPPGRDGPDRGLVLAPFRYAGSRPPALVGRGTTSRSRPVSSPNWSCRESASSPTSVRTRQPCAAASGVLAAAAVLGLAAGVAYVMVEPPPLTSTTLVLLPTPALAESSNSDVDTQVAHRAERQHSRAGRPGGRPGSSGAYGREDGRCHRADEPADPDRRDLHRRGRGADPLPGGRRRVRQLRPRHRARGDRRRPGGPHDTGETSCKGRSRSCRRRSRQPPSARSDSTRTRRRPRGSAAAGRTADRAGQPRDAAGQGRGQDRRRHARRNLSRGRNLGRPAGDRRRRTPRP